jgi:hypothetical protein
MFCGPKGGQTLAAQPIKTDECQIIYTYLRFELIGLLIIFT